MELYRQVKPEVLGVPSSHCHFVHHKSHSDGAGVEDVFQAQTNNLVSLRCVIPVVLVQ